MNHRSGITEDEREGGFTIVEMVVAITLLSGSLLVLANLMFGSTAAQGAVQQRSEMTQKATAEVELLRSTPYDEVCVESGDLSLYPTGRYEGRDAVIGATCPDAVTPRLADSELVAHTVTRWVTWTDAGGGAGHRLKRLTVLVEWQENGRSTRTVMLRSLLYPGGEGPVVPGANNAPTVTLSSPTVGAVVGTPVSFVAAASDLDAGDMLAYTWSFGDTAPPVASPGSSTITHSYAAAGFYTAQVKVTDARGLFSVATVDIVVAAPGPNTAPTARAVGVGPVNGTAPFAVTIDGGGSTDPEGGALAYAWNWGDGSAKTTGVQGSHSFAAAGTYTITLTVSDTGGLSSSDTVTATVVPLNCDLFNGSFVNPVGNAKANDVVVDGNLRPKSTSFTFTAKTNAACTSVSARLPHSGGTLVVQLAAGTPASGVTPWSGTGSVSGGEQFSTSANQTYDFWTPAPTGASRKLSIGFSVHK